MKTRFYWIGVALGLGLFALLLRPQWHCESRDKTVALLTDYDDIRQLDNPPYIESMAMEPLQEVRGGGVTGILQSPRHLSEVALLKPDGRTVDWIVHTPVSNVISAISHLDLPPGLTGEQSVGYELSLQKLSHGTGIVDAVRLDADTGIDDAVFKASAGAVWVSDDVPGVSRPVKVRLQVDGKYAKVYIDEARVANMPNAEFARGKEITFLFQSPGGEAGAPMPLIGNLRINAGGQPLYDALLANGRVATQGIFFDVGSDHIRPESAPTLAMIGAMLKDHGDLKLTIEGHTDNTGSPPANKALSEKRAAAVKAYLTSSFGIAAERLGSMGLGDTKPAASNGTSEGRQQNRRVELVKM